MEACLCELKEEEEGEELLDDKDSSQWEPCYPLTVDLWRTILLKLPVNYLGQAACVCHLWHSIASDHGMLSSRFKETWKLAHIVGRPSSTSFWHDANLGRFAISHAVEEWDTVAGLAVRYQVHVNEIKRLNNMMSDHGIYSRQRLLIPVSQQQLVEGKTCYIEVDPYAKREVAVLYLEGGQPKHTFLHRTKPKIKEACRRGDMESMKRSRQVDDATVHCYSSLTDGDIKDTHSKYNENLRWERSSISRVFPCFR